MTRDTESNLMERCSVALVEPTYPVNLGHVARTMRNFDVKELILVRPQVIVEEARAYASHATEVLEKVRTVSFDDLSRLFEVLVGTTAIPGTKPSNVLRKSITPEALATNLRGSSGRFCLVFGRDTTGLTNEELAACDIIVTIPTAGEYRTLNISHSVAIFLYELSKGRYSRKVRLAKREERRRLVQYAVELAEASGYPDYKRELLEDAFKHIITKSSPEHREVSLLMGLFRKALLAISKARFS